MMNQSQKQLIVVFLNLVSIQIHLIFFHDPIHTIVFIRAVKFFSLTSCDYDMYYEFKIYNIVPNVITYLPSYFLEVSIAFYRIGTSIISLLSLFSSFIYFFHRPGNLWRYWSKFGRQHSNIKDVTRTRSEMGSDSGPVLFIRHARSVRRIFRVINRTSSIISHIANQHAFVCIFNFVQIRIILLILIFPKNIYGLSEIYRIIIHQKA